MTESKTARISRLAEEHYNWLLGVLEVVHEGERDLLRKLYKDAFIHGYKHAEQDTKERKELLW